MRGIDELKKGEPTLEKSVGAFTNIGKIGEVTFLENQARTITTLLKRL